MLVPSGRPFQPPKFSVYRISGEVKDWYDGKIMDRAVLIVCGDDRPGVLDDVSRFILDRGCNIEESRVNSLRGQFALLLLVSGEGHSIGRLRSEVRGLAEADQLTIEVRPAGEGRASGAAPYRFVVMGTDQTALIQQASHLLRVLNVNIEDVQTTVSRGIDGSSSARVEMRLSVPRETPVVKLEEYLNTVCRGLNADGSLTPV